MLAQGRRRWSVGQKPIMIWQHMVKTNQYTMYLPPEAKKIYQNYLPPLLAAK